MRCAASSRRGGAGPGRASRLGAVLSAVCALLASSTPAAPPGAPASPGAPAPVVEVFVQADCTACRQQLRVLAAHQIPARIRPVDTDPLARRALEARLAALGRVLGDDQLPAVAVGAALLPADPPVARVLAQLDRPSRWIPQGGPARVQWFGALDGGPACPGVEAALAAAGLSVERGDAGDPAVAERMWVTLRLLGHAPRRGVRLPVWIVGERVIPGCPSAGVLAAALPRPAIVAQARAAIRADPEGFAERTLRALSTLRDRPRLGLQRLLLEPGLLAGDDPLVGQLSLARRRPGLERHPFDAGGGPTALVFDPLTPAQAAAQLLETAPAAWDPATYSAAARWREGPWGPALEVSWVPRAPGQQPAADPAAPQAVRRGSATSRWRLPPPHGRAPVRRDGPPEAPGSSP